MRSSGGGGLGRPTALEGRGSLPHPVSHVRGPCALSSGLFLASVTLL